MRIINDGFRIGVATAILVLGLANAAAAQPPRSGGFDLTYGVGTGMGGEYKDRDGKLTSVEVYFSTRLDGGNSLLLLGLQGMYFAADDADYDCLVSQFGGCVRKFPDVAAGAMLAAFEPIFLRNTFVQLSGGLAVVQPTSDGGPVFGWLGGVKLGQGIGRHLAVVGAARLLGVPNFRGEPVTLRSYSFGLRVR
jgi:hypothetical protein